MRTQAPDLSARGAVQLEAAILDFAQRKGEVSSFTSLIIIAWVTMDLGGYFNNPGKCVASYASTSRLGLCTRPRSLK